MTYNEIKHLCNTVRDKMLNILITSTRKSHLSRNEDREKEASVLLSKIIDTDVVFSTSDNILSIFVDNKFTSINDIDEVYLDELLKRLIKHETNKKENK